MFYGEGITRASHFYLGETPATHPLASPLYADLHGLPPLFIQASSSEVLRDDATRLAEKAIKAGVSVSMKLWHKTPHAWQLFVPFLPEARKALGEAAEFVRRVVP
jgi:epsilon-lactone hydrolase